MYYLLRVDTKGNDVACALLRMIVHGALCYDDVSMAWVIVGLGNPGEKYENTRHNTGRMAVEHFADAHKLGEWKHDKKANAHIVRGSVDGTLVVCVLPDTFMNKSGSAVGKYVKSVKAAEKCLVVYDDLDLPLGGTKMSFNRGSGGHKGIESIARTLKTKSFWRMRVGISPSTASGTLKKPRGEAEVHDFILKTFKPHDLAALKNVFKRTSHALEEVLVEGPMKAMNQFN